MYKSVPAAQVETTGRKETVTTKEKVEEHTDLKRRGKEENRKGKVKKGNKNADAIDRARAFI